MKRCSKCGEIKSYKEFQANRIASDGKRPECRDCSRQVAARYRKTNPDRIRERKKRYYEQFKERIMEKHREYRAANAEQIYQMYKAYRAKNREKIAEWWKKSPRGRFNVLLKLALKRRACANPATVDELMALWQKQKGLCAVTGLPMTWRQGKTDPQSLSIDRIDSTGSYELGNLRLICYQVNTFKNRWSDEQMLTMARAIVEQATPGPTWLGPQHFMHASAIA